jgi:hypothetical protein
MHKSQSSFYLTTALHVSGVTITHPQEHKTTVTTTFGNHYKNRSRRHLQHTQISSNSSTIATNNSTGTYIIHYSIELIAFFAEYTLFNNCNFNLVYRYYLSVNFTLSQCNGYQMLQLQLFCAPEDG